MCWGPMNPNSQSEGYCSVPIRQIAAASTKPAREQNRAPENCFRLGFEPLPSNPSPGPLRLVKAPAAGHPLPKGEGCAGNTSDSCPLLWGEGSAEPRLEASRRARVGGERRDGGYDAVLDGPIEAFQLALSPRGDADLKHQFRQPRAIPSPHFQTAGGAHLCFHALHGPSLNLPSFLRTLR